FEVRTYRDADREGVTALWAGIFVGGYEAPHNDPAVSIDLKTAYDPELFLVAVDGSHLVGTVMGGYDGHRGWIYVAGGRRERAPQGDRDRADGRGGTEAEGPGLPQGEPAGDAGQRRESCSSTRSWGSRSRTG
ncbi:Acetyltransferase ECA0875, partial [Geodia barretti]